MGAYEMSVDSEGMESLDLSRGGYGASPSLSARSSKRSQAPSGGHHHSHSYAEPQFYGGADAHEGNYYSSIFQQIWADSERQPILIYLFLRMAYTILTFIASSYSSSVGLVCVGFHALFECAGLAVELWAAAAERDREGQSLLGFSYGYQRLQVLSVFGSTVFLIFVSLFTLEHSIERFFEPPMVSSGLVTTLALVGCIINLLGLLVTQNSRAQDRQALQGQVLWTRLVTDNLVAFGVAFSAFCTQYGYHEADPIMAVIISLGLIYTSVPIAQQTKDILLLATPTHLQRDILKCMGAVHSIEGVLECSQDHFWTCSNNNIVGSMCITVADQADEQAILRRVQSIFDKYVNNLTVEIQRNNWDVSNQLRDVDINA